MSDVDVILNVFNGY